MRFCIIVLLAAVVVGTSADGATKAQCRSACTAFVTACRTDDCGALTGKKSRRCAKRCRKQSERRCRTTSLEACALPEPPDPPDPPNPPAAKYYSGIDLGTLGGLGSNAAALNDHGDVVGTSETEGWAVRAFIWSGGVMKGLGTFGGMDSHGLAINGLGHVAGVANDTVAWLPFLHVDGSMTKLAVFTYPPGKMAVNDDGRVVGSYYTAAFFVWPPISLPATPEIEAIEDVNAAGLMAGTIRNPQPKAARFSADGVATVLGTLAGPGYPNAVSYGKAINGEGDVVGQAQTNVFALHACLWADDGMIDLGTLHGVLGEESVATDINDAGQILGWSGQQPYYQPIPGLKTEYFLYEHGTMRSVGSLIDPALGWTIVSADAINARGQIAATAFTGRPKPHAVLLTPPQ